MRHLKKGRKLSRERNQRKALLKTLLGSLIMREKIQLTEAKAKEIKRRIDKVISKAKRNRNDASNTPIIRELLKILPENATKKLTGNFLEKFNKRNSGYARIVKLNSRKSDGARMAIVEFVD